MEKTGFFKKFLGDHSPEVEERHGIESLEDELNIARKYLKGLEITGEQQKRERELREEVNEELKKLRASILELEAYLALSKITWHGVKKKMIIGYLGLYATDQASLTISNNC